MKTDIKFEKFQELAGLLNAKLQIVPLLYGSLGLEVLTGHDFNADDVDILVPKQFIFDKWSILENLLENNGYKLVDLHEHTFEKYNYEFSFAGIENLEKYTEISANDISVITAKECQYKLLSLSQYLVVYEKFSRDEYRIMRGKNPRDLYKVEYLKEKLSQESTQNK